MDTERMHRKCVVIDELVASGNTAGHAGAVESFAETMGQIYATAEIERQWAQDQLEAGATDAVLAEYWTVMGAIAATAATDAPFLRAYGDLLALGHRLAAEQG